MVTLFITPVTKSHEPLSKGPCTQIVYTLAPKYLNRDYIEAIVYTIWVHGPLGLVFFQEMMSMASRQTASTQSSGTMVRVSVASTQGSEYLLVVCCPSVFDYIETDIIRYPKTLV